ncbi:MAG TPA: adenylyltransferase/cytidyltransferase family protein [Patescibacteria group bacterium]|nr:adenylyltransferase/cytidyltransferase family protein [Patescibacteria group bacterium]
MSRIGILAGVFDPIHLGHTEFIAQAIKDHKLDKVYILVEKDPKYKTCLASYEHRKEMVGLAVSDIDKIEIYESPRDFFPISSSVPVIKKDNSGSELFLLIGDDVWKHIPSWEDAEELLQTVKPIIAKRNQGAPYSQASSLKIRQSLGKGEDSKFIDSRVLAYCKSNKLYLTSGA